MVCQNILVVLGLIRIQPLSQPARLSSFLSEPLNEEFC